MYNQSLPIVAVRRAPRETLFWTGKLPQGFVLCAARWPTVLPRRVVRALCGGAFDELHLCVGVGPTISSEAQGGLPLEGRVSYRFLRVSAQVVAEGEVATQHLASSPGVTAQV